MSLAGIRSNRGDAYQRSLALYWTVKMLLDDKISGIQVDAVSTPNDEKPAYQDDIIILYKNGYRTFIQAKVNQSKHENWKLTDLTLIKELESCKLQLQTKPNYEVHFYSRTPFGMFQRLIEENSIHPNVECFLRDAPQVQKDVLAKLTEIWDVDDATTFSLIRRIKIGSHLSASELLDLSHELLKPTFSRAGTALELIYNHIDRQHLHLSDSKVVLERQDIIETLNTHGIYQAQTFNETVFTQSLRTFSAQGRQWVRTIGGEKIQRKELNVLKKAIAQKTSSILLEDTAGGGKTCLLLDLMDYLDNQTSIIPLFIKGDIFASINALKDLEQYGLPEDFIAKCASLAETKYIVIAIDSLDVLAVGRSHNSLKCFLGLISSLSNIPNITVIAASRSFDLKYDPLLREMKWEEIVSISPLSFDDNVTPLLNKLGHKVNSLSEKLKTALIIPQSLRLFYELLQKGMTIAEVEEHNLYEMYLQELVEKDTSLGGGVLSALQETSLNLLQMRSYEFHKNTLKVTPDQLKHLLSKQIIMEVDHNQLMFSHQTLADTLRIRQAFQQNITLLDFVTSQPQLPFIRPAVRSLIYALKGKSNQQFIRQLRVFLLSDKVSMHLKRLAVETFAKMNVYNRELSIVITLSNQQPQLFQRLLEKASNNSWFLLIHDQLIPAVNMHASQQNTHSILYFISKFFKGNEEGVVQIWHRAIDEEWINIRVLTYLVSSQLNTLKNWSIPKIEDVLEKLLDNYNDDFCNLGESICQYVNATGSGDSLLWKYITLNTKPINDLDRIGDIQLNCNPHDLLTENYFEERLKVSDELFTLAMNYLLSFTNISSSELYVDFLNHTSYEKRHSHRDSYSGDSINVFLSAIEQAMKYRCRQNDNCWRSIEPQIRVCDDLGLLYLLIESYQENTLNNIEGISILLTSRDLFKHSNLEHELGSLALSSYPYLSNGIREKHQKNIVSLYNEKERKDYWTLKAMYEHLVWVPAMYRLPELSATLIEYEKKYGSSNELRQPRIGSWSGFVGSPISSEQILNFSTDGLVHIFKHYVNEDGFSDQLMGGLDSIERELSSAATQSPLRFIPVTHALYQSGAPISSVISIIDGISSHLSHRFGGIKSSNWNGVDPLPDGTSLAHELLNLVERYGKYDLNKYKFSSQYNCARAIQACSHILKDDISIERLCFQLWKLSTNESPKLEKDNDTENLTGIGINSVRGIAAETVLVICDQLLEQGKDLSLDLTQLLRRFAKDSSMAVRAAFLIRFPYFLSKMPDLGWELIDAITIEATPKLFHYLEQSLYYQYESSFDRVAPYLEQLKLTNDESTASAWGRLSTLCYLSGHISEESLWKDIHLQHQAAQTGIGQVFTANYMKRKHSKKCLAGLKKLFKSGASTNVFDDFERSLSDKKNLHFISLELIKSFIQNSSFEQTREVDGVFFWLEKNVLQIPNAVLNIIEEIIERISHVSENVYFHQEEPLLSTFKSLLQEADLTDHEGFIERVLSAQYWFMEKGIKDIEELIEP